MNMTTVPSNQLKAMQQEIADLKETIAQQAEAIRLKDAALIAVRDDLELRMQIAEDESLNISNSVLDQMCDAIDLQPSPEILQARDEPVAYLDANYGFMRCGNAADHLPIGTKLYAVPPQPAKEKWHVSGVDIQEAINLIESQAAEIGVLKIAHEAHQTNNLKMLAVLKKQNAEIEKYKALCNQMGNALQMMRGFYPAYCDEALEAWRAMK